MAFSRANTIEKILFRRALDKRLDGYTLETSIEIAEAVATQEGSDTARLDWLEKHTINVRVPLPHGSRDLFWASPDDSCEGEESPSDIRAKIDAAKGNETMTPTIHCTHCGQHWHEGQTPLCQHMNVEVSLEPEALGQTDFLTDPDNLDAFMEANPLPSPTDAADFDDDPFEYDEEDDDLDECGMMPNGQCSMAGSEWCDWSCPRERMRG